MRNIKKRSLNLNPGGLGKGSDCKVMTGRPSYLYDVKTICEICSRSKVKVLYSDQRYLDIFAFVDLSSFE